MEDIPQGSDAGFRPRSTPDAKQSDAGSEPGVSGSDPTHRDVNKSDVQDSDPAHRDANQSGVRGRNPVRDANEPGVRDSDPADDANEPGVQDSDPADDANEPGVRGRNPVHHKYKKRKFQVRRMEQRLYEIYGATPEWEWTPSNLFEFATPLVKGTDEYDYALELGKPHMKSNPDIILRQIRDQHTLEYIYKCRAAEAFRLKHPIQTSRGIDDVEILQHPNNTLKIYSSGEESDGDD